MKKTFMQLALLTAVTACWGVSYAQSTLDVNSIYNSASAGPNTVFNGNGDPLGEVLEGKTLWVICLDEDGILPSLNGNLYDYDLSPNSSILNGGVWGGIPVGSGRNAILGGISNIYFNNESALLYDSANSNPIFSFNNPTDAIQLAAWELIETYGTIWSGALTTSAIDDILTASLASFEGTLVEDYLYSSLDQNSSGVGRVFFGTPAGATPSDMQPLMLISPVTIPEPSGILLVGLVGSLALLRRRRSI